MEGKHRARAAGKERGETQSEEGECDEERVRRVKREKERGLKKEDGEMGEGYGKKREKSKKERRGMEGETERGWERETGRDKININTKNSLNTYCFYHNVVF